MNSDSVSFGKKEDYSMCVYGVRSPRQVHRSPEGQGNGTPNFTKLKQKSTTSLNKRRKRTAVPC